MVPPKQDPSKNLARKYMCICEESDIKVFKRIIIHDTNIIVLFLPNVSHKFVKNKEPNIPPRGTRLVRRAIWKVLSGFPVGFMSVPFDLSLQITGEVHAPLTPQENTKKHAEKYEIEILVLS